MLSIMRHPPAPNLLGNLDHQFWRRDPVGDRHRVADDGGPRKRVTVPGLTGECLLNSEQGTAPACSDMSGSLAQSG